MFLQVPHRIDSWSRHVGVKVRSIMANILLAEDSNYQSQFQGSGVKIETQQILQDARFREWGILFNVMSTVG